MSDHPKNVLPHQTAKRLRTWADARDRRSEQFGRTGTELLRRAADELDADHALRGDNDRLRSFIEANVRHEYVWVDHLTRRTRTQVHSPDCSVCAALAACPPATDSGECSCRRRKHGLTETRGCPVHGVPATDSGVRLTEEQAEQIADQLGHPYGCGWVTGNPCTCGSAEALALLRGVPG